MQTEPLRQAYRGKVVIAYLLWFFLGWIAAHRFYLGKWGSAFVMLMVSGLGWLTIWFGVGLLLLAPLGLWLLVDLFLIPGMARRQVGYRR